MPLLPPTTAAVVPAGQTNMNTSTPTALANEALDILNHQLAQPQPCVASASTVLGVLQDRLFQASCEPLEAAVAEHMLRFQELLVAPAAAKLGKCKQPQDKVVSIAKFLRGKLAKAPAHKQPLHTQYLPSALRTSGKRQLDCLGIATAVLAMCHRIAAQWPQLHADLAASTMVVSDDHCWLALPAPTTADDGGGGSSSNQQQELVYVEVTDPGVLAPGQLSGSWLYAGGHGTVCSNSQVVLVLVAGLMPEELQDKAAAEQLREVQMQLLAQLAAAHPQALFYSNYFRWGMLHEETELQQLAAAAEAAAASGSMAELEALAMLPAEQLQSQQYYSTSLQSSAGWQWHPCSCAAFGWLNRMQAALCGETDDLLCLTHQQQWAPGHAKQWLDSAVFLLQQALRAVQDCTAVLRKYSGCTGKPNKAADTQLMEAVRDLWQNLADASKALALLHELQAQQDSLQLQQQPQQDCPHDQQPTAAGSVEGSPAAADAQQQQQQQPVVQRPAGSSGPTGHHGSDMPAAAAATGHTVHLAAAINKAAGGCEQQGAAHFSMKDVLSNSSWLRPQLEFMDAVLCFFGEKSADVPAGIVTDFVTIAGTYSSTARVEAVEESLGQQALLSSRTQGLLGSPDWRELQPGVQQELQMPGARSRKRQRRD